MNIAVAQIRPKEGDIKKNLHEHYKYVKLAGRHGVDLIAFPEMSVTGYVRELAKELSFTENDSRLNELREQAKENNIIIVAGAPIKLNSGLHIGSFILYPDNTLSIYTKQFLHPGETEYFSSNFNHNPIIKLNNEQISLAICADIDHPVHAENAYKAESTIYLASIFFSKPSIAEAHNILSNYAGKHSMTVIMSNFCGESWGLEAGGKSAFWSEEGIMVAELETSASGILIARKNLGKWTGEVICEV